MEKNRGVRIAVLPGDGIGPEVVEEALKVLRALEPVGLRLETTFADVGGIAVDRHGDPLPAQTLALARASDAVLFGAVGGPRYDTAPRAQRPEQGPAAAAQGTGPVCQPAAGADIPGAGRGLRAQSRDRRRLGHTHYPLSSPAISISASPAASVPCPLASARDSTRCVTPRARSGG